MTFFITQEEVEKNVESRFSDYAQKSNPTDRVAPEPVESARTEFERDRDRILHSKSFRRLMHKTQVFAMGGDEYFRTRLTHTLEVMQIACQIARNLGVNDDLVEAIALGHDLGHTPFGHAGERLLNEILTGKEDLAEKINNEIPLGGFKHNYQSLRIIDTIGRTYPNVPGLNLTWQVREGIWKHTKIRDEGDKRLLCDYPNFKLDLSDRLFPDYNFSVTIEGQIVGQADEIAQKAHDLDDGLASGTIAIDDIFGNYVYSEEIFGGLDYYKRINDNYVQRQQLINKVIKYFTESLINNSMVLIEGYWKDRGNKERFINQHILEKELVKFDGPTKDVLERLEELITARVINSYKVNVSDGKATYILKHIIKAYIANPRQLNPKVLSTCRRRINENSMDCVDLLTGRKDDVEREILELQARFNKLNPEDAEGHRRSQILKKHGIFMRTIVDHIAGMTDNFANQEFKNLYIP